MNEEPKIIVVGNIYDEKDEFLSAGRVYSGGGIAPSLGAAKFASEKLIIEITKIEEIKDD